MGKLRIIATIVAKADFREDILKALYAVTDATRKEESNISYLLHEDNMNSSRFIIVEEWKSQEAIDSHNQTSHFLAFKQALDGKIENLSIEVIKEIY